MVKNEIKKLEDEVETYDSNQTYESTLFVGQSYFFNDRTQLYLIFQTLFYTLKRLNDTEKTVSWFYICKGFSTKNLILLPLLIISLSIS